MKLHHHPGLEETQKEDVVDLQAAVLRCSK